MLLVFCYQLTSSGHFVVYDLLKVGGDEIDERVTVRDSDRGGTSD